MKKAILLAMLIVSVTMAQFTVKERTDQFGDVIPNSYIAVTYSGQHSIQIFMGIVYIVSVGTQFDMNQEMLNAKFDGVTSKDYYVYSKITRGNTIMVISGESIKTMLASSSSVKFIINNEIVTFNCSGFTDSYEKVKNK